MNSGIVLKQNLGLSKFPHVKIRRLIATSSIPIYQVVFNSRLPNLPLTSYMLRNNPLMPFIVGDNFKKFYATPFLNIENFVGSLQEKIFICTDISGFYGKTKNYDFFVESTKTKEFKIFLYGKLNEFITLPALMDKQADLTSRITKHYKSIRKDIQKTANINTKLIQTELSGNDVIFKFLTEATEMYGPKHKYSQINPETKEFEPNPSKTYEIWIKLLNVIGDNGWISTFDLNSEVLTQKDIKDIIKVSNCQLWSNDPSFQWQGMNWGLTQLDASIYPENIPPNTWGPRHGGSGNYFLTKHLSQLIDSLPFFFNQMASALTNVLRKNNIIPKYRRK
jgi:hypothetical protein